MEEPTRRYWFPAKRYGWGWGMPTSWQGWVVLVSWLLVVAAVTPFVQPHEHPLLFGLFMLVMLAVMVAIGYAKGEPPRWRWGDKDDQKRTQ